MTTPTNAALDALIALIAKAHLNVQTLNVQNADRLDFHDLHVASIKSALYAAYELGKTTPLSDPGIPRTQNEGFGFYGTMGGIAEQAWDVAMRLISETTQQPFEAVRAFLDCSYGRHFADDVRSQIQRGAALREAVQATTQSWWGKQVKPRDSTELQAKVGAPLLTSMIIYADRCAQEQ